MRRTARCLALGLILWLPSISAASNAEPVDRDVVRPLETNHSATSRAFYFPFLAVGHGVFLIVKYGIAYPVYFIAKPAIDFMYSSPDDPADFPTSVPPAKPPSR